MTWNSPRLKFDGDCTVCWMIGLKPSRLPLEMPVVAEGPAGAEAQQRACPTTSPWYRPRPAAASAEEGQGHTRQSQPGPDVNRVHPSLLNQSRCTDALLGRRDRAAASAQSPSEPPRPRKRGQTPGASPSAPRHDREGRGRERSGCVERPAGPVWRGKAPRSRPASGPPGPAPVGPGVSAGPTGRTVGPEPREWSGRRRTLPCPWVGLMAGRFESGIGPFETAIVAGLPAGPLRWLVGSVATIREVEFRNRGGQYRGPPGLSTSSFPISDRKG